MTCSICMEDANNKITTPCSHTFCNTCLTKWLFNNDSCPMCRKELGVKVEEEEEEELYISEKYNLIRNNDVHIIDKYVRDFEEELFDLIDNIDNEPFLRERNVVEEDGVYKMYVEFDVNKKVVSAEIEYDSIDIKAKFKYDVRYIVPKCKKRVIRTNKKVNNIKNIKKSYRIK